MGPIAYLFIFGVMLAKVQVTTPKNGNVFKTAFSDLFLTRDSFKVDNVTLQILIMGKGYKFLVLFPSHKTSFRLLYHSLYIFSFIVFSHM